jgi:hypothetical protein
MMGPLLARLIQFLFFKINLWNKSETEALKKSEFNWKKEFFTPETQTTVISLVVAGIRFYLPWLLATRTAILI